jgi:hypothetical protein
MTWSSATSVGAVYVAALDREQHAALVYSQTVERVARFPERSAA